VQRGLEMDLPSYDPDVRSALVAGVELEVTADVLARQPTEDELRQYYAAHSDRYSTEGVMRLRDLVTADPTVAAAAVSELRAGKPLDAVMLRHALKDSGKFMKAGQVDTDDLYQFAVRAKLDDPLFQAAQSLQSGQVSDPIKQADGVHLLFMVAHRLAVAQSFEQSRARVWNDLKQQAQSQVREANLRYLRGRADILVAADFPQ
jgi:parvulin-like peptidyl-prolyl isomerase